MPDAQAPTAIGLVEARVKQLLEKPNLPDRLPSSAELATALVLLAKHVDIQNDTIDRLLNILKTLGGIRV